MRYATVFTCTPTARAAAGLARWRAGRAQRVLLALLPTDVAGTLQAAIAKINALENQPDLIIHTGDLTHLAKAEEFDTLDQSLKSLRRQDIVYVPGEHDVTGDDGRLYLERFGKGSAGRGWRSFNHKGVHFAGLHNAVQLEGLGTIGAEQLDWLKNHHDELMEKARKVEEQNIDPELEYEIAQAHEEEKKARGGL